jgi:hypothetical protein
MPHASYWAIFLWSFRYVFTSEVPHDLDPSAVFRSLLRHPAYAFSFTSPYPERPRLDTRGPFVLSQLSVESFVPTTKETLWAAVDEFIHDPNDEATRADLGIDAQTQATIDGTNELFQLRPRAQLELPTEPFGDDELFHASAFTISEYAEFVALNQAERSVLVLAMIID